MWKCRPTGATSLLPGTDQIAPSGGNGRRPALPRDNPVVIRFPLSCKLPAAASSLVISPNSVFISPLVISPCSVFISPLVISLSSVFISPLVISQLVISPCSVFISPLIIYPDQYLFLHYLLLCARYLFIY